jgi:2-oxo-4-hydroxy-4-carboxy-5-ureidoimidazoline decarboxylase
MNIHDLNNMDQRRLRDILFESSDCSSWSKIMLTHFPVDDLADLLENAEEVWYECNENEWKEAFVRNSTPLGKNSLNNHDISESLLSYQEKFGFPFIAYVNGNSPNEISENLFSRLQNAPDKEIRIAADEQLKHIRTRIENLFH